MFLSSLFKFKNNSNVVPEPIIQEYRKVIQPINVPSGKLVVANSFSLLFGKKHEQEALDYLLTNKGSERDVRVDYWSTKGIAYIPTSSTIPDLFLNQSRDYMEIRYDITPDSQYYDSYTKTSDIHCPVIDGGLWAVCAMDLDLLKSYADERFNFDFNNDFGLLEASIIDVVPGCYELEILHNWPKVDEELLIYGKIKKFN